MKIYVLIIQDRHTDTTAYLYSTLEKAIGAANTYLLACEGLNHVDPEDRNMSAEDLAAANWLFFVQYSNEGDCVWIYAADVDSNDAPGLAELP